jgi:hypothetical protein
MRHQHQIPTANFREDIDGAVLGAVDPLVTDRVVALDIFRGGVGELELEVVDLLELTLLTRLVLVVPAAQAMIASASRTAGVPKLRTWRDDTPAPRSSVSTCSTPIRRYG